MTPEQMQAYIAQGYTMDQIMAAKQEAAALQTINTGRKTEDDVAALAEQLAGVDLTDAVHRLPAGDYTVEIKGVRMKARTQFGSKFIVEFGVVGSGDPTVSRTLTYSWAATVDKAHDVYGYGERDAASFSRALLEANGHQIAAPKLSVDQTKMVFDPKVHEGTTMALTVEAKTTKTGRTKMVHYWHAPRSETHAVLPGLPPLPKLG